MLIVLSPAKSLDFASPWQSDVVTQPRFLDEARELVDRLRGMSPVDIAELMGISDALAVLNAGRYSEWSIPFSPGNARPAILAFDGDVYDGLGARAFSPADLQKAQDRLRILSGLYGLLRPLDLIQAYRLDMGTKLANPRGKDLYAFWGSRIAEALASDLREAGASVLVNLASNEYFKALPTGALSVPVIQPVFEDWRAGQFKVVSFFAKRARGMMARFAVRERLSNPEELKAFSDAGYQFSPGASDERRWVFRRTQQ